MSTAEFAPPQQPVEALYVDHHGWLQGWLRRRLGDAFDAADVTHDTFLRLLVSGRTPTPDQSRAHLAQIAKGLVVDLRRRRAVEASYLDALAHLPEDRVPSLDVQAQAVEALLLLDAALGGLPARVRETFLLARLDGLTYSAIAQRLGISVGAVRKYMLRGAQACHSVWNPTAS